MAGRLSSPAHFFLRVLFVLIGCLLAQAQNASPENLRSGIFRGRWITYEVIGSRNLFQGDIVLENVSTILATASSPSLFSVTVAYPDNLWANVGGVYEVPYTVASGGSSVTQAISSFNSTFAGLIQWVPWSGETDYVEFDLDPNDTSNKCNSDVGRVGGKQFISGAGNCSVVLHLLGHTVGLWHELTRSDRDTYARVYWQNVEKSKKWTFIAPFDNVQSIGLYDYGSQMQYSGFQFSKNNQPTVDSIPAGMRLGTRIQTFSAGDVDAIRRLYGSTPQTTTVTTNPPGLQVIVDGTTITSPQTFMWALNSTHTLSVPPNPQPSGKVAYLFGRWNDNGASSHTINVMPGNGLATSPRSTPAITTYVANFIELVPVTFTVSPAASGTIALNPQPTSYPGLSGNYYRARQMVTVTATPGAGYNFYGWNNSPLLGKALSDNPKVFWVPDNDNAISVRAQFTSSPVATIEAPDLPSTTVQVDGKSWVSPKNFALPYDSSWTAGSLHTIAIVSPQTPFPASSRYLWQKWSDGGAQSHTIHAPVSTAKYIARLKRQWLVTTVVNQGCGGTLTLTPPRQDGFYDAGTTVSFSESASPGWTFAGWSSDLSGTTNPQAITVKSDVLVMASYNTSSTPLTLHNLVPASATAGQEAFFLTLNGSGFSVNSSVLVNGTPRTFTFVSSTQLTVSIEKSDIATPGAFQVAVQNAPPGAACAAFAPLTFFVKSI